MTDLEAVRAELIQAQAERDTARREAARLLEEQQRPTCNDCGVVLGDNWCADCAGSVYRDQAAEAQARAARLRDLLACVRLSLAAALERMLKGGSGQDVYNTLLLSTAWENQPKSELDRVLEFELTLPLNRAALDALLAQARAEGAQAVAETTRAAAGGSCDRPPSSAAREAGGKEPTP